MQHEKTYASLEAGDDVLNIGLNRAVTLIAEKIAKGPSKRRFGADPGKPLGDHPTLGPVAVKTGRYGAYVTAGGVNATIPNDKTPDTITLRRSDRADRRARRQGRRRPRPSARPRRRQAEEGRKPPATPSRPKKAAAKKAKPKAENRRRQQGARAGDGREPRRPKPQPRSQIARQEERGQERIDVSKTRDADFPDKATHPRLHPRASRQGRHPRDRARLRPEERRPRRTQALLRELADDGTIRKRGRRKVAEPADPAPDVLADIIARDSDGELIASPSEWDEQDGDAAEDPHPHPAPPQARHPSAGVGDRALLRVEPSASDGDRSGLSRPRHQADRPRQAARARHLPRAAATAADGWCRSTRSRPGANSTSPPQMPAAPRTAISSPSTSSARRGFGLPRATCKERLGSLATEKAVSLIAIHAHDIPQEFSPAALREAEAAEPATLQGREDWRDLPLVTIDPPDAKDHDDAVHAEPDADPANQGGFIVTSPSPTSPTTCGRARRSTARRWCAAIRSTSPTASCRCCRSGSPTICAR